MAAKGSGGGGGAHLASGYISLNVKYGSAMAQIADDFGLVNKRAKETGESITKNLVAKVDAAKAKAAGLAKEYEEQRQRVAALRGELTKLHAAQASASAVSKAFAEANTRETQRKVQYQQQSVNLQLELNQLMSAQKWDSAALERWNAKFVEVSNRRKAELKELAEAGEAYRKSGKSASDSVAAEADTRKRLEAEIAKGTEEYKKLGQALQDVTRKQDLAKASAAALAGTQASFGARFVTAMRNVGTQAGQYFRGTFGHEMRQAKVESSHHARNIASGIFMGMTPGVMGAAGVGIAFGKAFSMGFQREETIETTKLRLEALGLSAASVQSLIVDATGTVEGTQFSLAEAFTAASTAMQAGIKQGPDMVQYLNNIANAAGLTGVEYGEVAESIGRVQRLGSVSLENIDPLIKKDLPILKWLKEYYQKDFPSTTTEDITDMISKKMIPADVLNKVLTANLNNSMKGLTRKTTTGALRDLMTQVGKVTQSILHPFMGDWPTFINSIGGKISRFAEYIKPGMASAAEWIKKTWNDLWPKVTGVIGRAVAVMTGMWDRFGPTVMKAIGWLWEKWKALWPRLTETVGGVVDWITKKWGEIWPHISAFITRLQETWSAVWPKIQEKLGPFVAAFKRLWENIAPLVKGLAALFGWMALEFIKRIPVFMEVGKAIMNGLSTGIEWMRDTAWPWLKQAWKNVNEWMDTAIKTVGRWKDNVIDAFNTIKSKTEGVWNWLQEKWDWLNGLSITGAVKWLLEHSGLTNTAGGINLSSLSTPLLPASAVAQPAGDSVPKPDRLIDSGHVPSGPQSKYVAGLILKQFDIQGTIGGSYLPRTEGGPSVPGTHDAGLSIDIPIGPSDEQRSMGDRIEKYLQDNAKQLGIVYTIWKNTGRQTGMNPNRPAGTTFYSGGHQDHIDVMFDGKTFGKEAREAFVGPTVRGAPGRGFPVPWTLGGGPDSAVPQPPSPSVADVLLGNAANQTATGTTNVRTPSLTDAMLGSTISTGPSGGIVRVPKASDVILGNAAQPTSATPLVVPSLVPQLGPWPGGIPGAKRPGPKGTADDPVITHDPKVADNTNPDNQPKPGAGQADSQGGGAAPGQAGSTPHGGTGAAPGPGASASGGVTPGSGDSVKELAQGLGGVASTAFSDQFAGTPFSDPTQWPLIKSAGAALSFFGSLLTGGGGPAAGGLVGMLFGGNGVGGKTATAKQLREAQDAVTDKSDAVAKQQAKIDSMVGKPQFEMDPEAMQEERDQLTRMIRERDQAIADQAELQGGGQAANPWGSFLSSWGVPQPVSTGTQQQPFGNPLIGSPGIAPGVDGPPDVMQPGSSNIGSTLINAIPTQPGNPANLAPGQQNTGGQVNIDNSIHQQVSTPGITEARDAANRSLNTQHNSALMGVMRGALVQ